MLLNDKKRISKIRPRKIGTRLGTSNLTNAGAVRNPHFIDTSSITIKPWIVSLATMYVLSTIKVLFKVLLCLASLGLYLKGFSFTESVSIFFIYNFSFIFKCKFFRLLDKIQFLDLYFLIIYLKDYLP